MIPITLDRNMTPLQRERVARSSHPRKRMMGGIVADRIALHKAIALCWQCERKVPDRVLTEAGYVNRSNIPYVSGPCDGCEEWMGRGKLWVHRDHLPGG